MVFIVEEKNEVATFIVAIPVLLMKSKAKKKDLDCGRKLPIWLYH